MSGHSTDGDAVQVFLDSLFPPDAAGCIEVRVIEDRKKGALIDRRWLSGPGDVLRTLPELIERAGRARAGIFFGVLPRKAQGKGKAEDTAPGHAAWVDLDFDDFDGGEEEARSKLTEFPLQPSMLVRSGHGLHLYLLLREPTEPAELSRISQLLAEALGGDHVFDAARILRLPGTRNFKDPERPVAVEIEVLAADQVYNLSEIENALDMVAPRTTAGSSAGRSVLDARVLALLDKHPRLRALFEGTGKPEMGDDGRRLDTTSSGYDFSLALALGRRGIKEPEILANAVRNRPDGAARAKGESYISRTVAQALERIALVEVEDGPDFEVERIRVFSSNPPIYELVIEGTAIRMGSAELSSPRLFSLRFMNALRRIPELPQKAGWTRWVNEKLADAETVEQPPEASDEEALREAVGTVITDLPVGTEAVDLDHGKALELDGGLVIFKVDSVLRGLKEDFPALRRHELCRVLRDLGFVSGSHAAPGKTVRAWSSPSHTRARESR